MEPKTSFTLAAADNPALPVCNNTIRWTPARKLAVVLHILDQENGLLKSREAALLYYEAAHLGAEELERWIIRVQETGGNINALKQTQINNPKYRPKQNNI